MKAQQQPEHGEIVIYQDRDGKTSLEVQLEEETVWLTQSQMTIFFDRDKRTISEHIRKVYKTNYYNLDVIISVGYRVKSKRDTQFRIWATNIRKEHLSKGYSLNSKRLAEKGLAEMEQAVALLSRTLQRNELVTDEGKAVLDVVDRYAKSWSLLLQYDEDRLELPPKRHLSRHPLDYERIRKSIRTLKNDLLQRGEASELLGQERGQHLQGILGNLDQTFDGHDLYARCGGKSGPPSLLCHQGSSLQRREQANRLISFF